MNFLGSRLRQFGMVLSLCGTVFTIPIPAAVAGFSKVHDVIIYKDSRFHSAFPSVIKRPDGEIWVAFRRAPNRKMFGEAKNYHVDPNSYLMLMRSRDGVTWSGEPTLLFADPFGGSQDPCLLQLRDDALICATYGWTFVRPDGLPHLPQPHLENFPGSIFNGGSYLRSKDGGQHWDGPLYPPSTPVELLRSPVGGGIVPAYNRGAMVETRDGRVLWAVASTDQMSPRKTSVHLMVSNDKGITWKYSGPIATDEKVSFNETSLYETPKGEIIAFLRTEDLADQAAIARSLDGGKSFQPWRGMGFMGHPLHALRLRDNRVLLTYGYRHAPLGIRARILNAECSDFSTASEIVLRDDGGTSDLGYPWSVQLDDHRVLVVYYFNVGREIQHIAGTVLEIR